MVARALIVIILNPQDSCVRWISGNDLNDSVVCVADDPNHHNYKASVQEVDIRVSHHSFVWSGVSIGVSPCFGLYLVQMAHGELHDVESYRPHGL